MKYHVIQGDWLKLGEYARPIREAVFVQEQGVPAELEYDDRDALFHHVVVFVEDIPVATGRVDSEGKIGRVAVLSAYRREGLGRVVMDALESMAQSLGLKTAVVHAQIAALRFYEKLDYVSAGSEFMEADMPHQRMIKNL